MFQLSQFEAEKKNDILISFSKQIMKMTLKYSLVMLNHTIEWQKTHTHTQQIEKRRENRYLHPNSLLL